MPRSLRNPPVGPITLNLIAALVIMALYNRTFWRLGYGIFDQKLGVVALFGAAVWALTVLVLMLLAFRWWQKPMLAFLFILCAVTSFYVDTLGAVIDRDMIQNALTTTVTESKHLITPDFIWHVVLYGIVPAALVMWIPLRRVTLWRNLWTQVLCGTVAAVLCIGLLLSYQQTFATVLRGNKELMASYQPGAPLTATFKYARMMMKSRVITLTKIGLDAKEGPYLKAVKKPVLLVIAAGETARAQNWGLNGYARDTTPELAKRNIVNFTHASSCGTATATSLPCMFSSFAREDYDYELGIGTENLLDVLAHAGLKVEWWDNNTGDKQIASRLPKRAFQDLKVPEFCDTGECNDGVFLAELKKVADTMTEDTVIVTHQIGSHGPAYYLRYPKEFERFTPACQTAELKNCSLEEIRNAYDNTITYTDHILAQTIDMLNDEDRVIPALYYVSDHGESLGENGLFLHGAPYMFAPDDQKEVPMVIWMSDRFATDLAIDPACLKAKADLPVSQDNMFHTILGMLDIQTAVHDAALDLTADCRKPAS